MIIVEGPDGSGKSTMIARLGYERHAFKSLRGGVGGDTKTGWAGDAVSPIDAYLRQILLADELEAAGRHIAFDRFHLSEAVYGPILRHRQEMTRAELSLLTSVLRRRRIPVILCMPPFPSTLATVAREGRDRPAYQTEGFLHQAYRAFESLAPWATHVFNYERDTLPVDPAAHER